MASHVVEHVNPAKFGFINWMNEAWRVLKVEGQLALSMPYATSPGMYQDPTHINFCNEITWAYFDPLEPNTQGYLYKIYRPKPWKIIHLSWDCAGNMEVLLEKRREDKSYYE
jgi:DNA modification methylase